VGILVNPGEEGRISGFLRNNCDLELVKLPAV
jgi:hypothetical protein